MTTLAHPFRIDAAGRAVTVEQGSARHAAEACGHGGVLGLERECACTGDGDLHVGDRGSDVFRGAV